MYQYGVETLNSSRYSQSIRNEPRTLDNRRSLILLGRCLSIYNKTVFILSNALKTYIKILINSYLMGSPLNLKMKKCVGT